MKEKIKGMRLSITISGILTIIIGILLLVYPTESLTTIGKVIGGIVIIAGLGIVIGQIYENGFNAMGIMVGGVLALIGIWIFISPSAIVSIIPIAIGVLLVVHGLQDLGLGVEAVRASAPRSWLAFVFAVITILLGAVCVAGAFKIITVATRIIGIMLIYDGITDIGIVRKVRKATSVVDSVITSEENI